MIGMLSSLTLNRFMIVASDNPEINYRLFNILEAKPNLTQRQMAKEMGISLGKCNYCLKELGKKWTGKGGSFHLIG